MRFVLAFLFLILIAANGLADVSREEKAAYIIKTENFRGQITAATDETINESIKQLNAALHQELDEKSQDLIKKEMEQIVEELVDPFIADVVDVYLEHFTDDEIDAIYRFYQSPEGKSIGAKLPEIERQIFLINAGYLKIISDRAVSRLADRLGDSQ